MLNAFIASVGYAGGILADKIVLCRKKVPVLRFIPLLFVFLAFFTSLLLYRYGKIDWAALTSTNYMLLFMAMILVAVTWNIFYYRGIQQEDIHEFELIMLLSPMMTIILAGIFLPAEREWQTFVAGIVASAALIVTRFRHHHSKIGRVAWQTMLAMLLMSFESILIKELLAVLSPVSLYFVRTAIIAIVFIVVYKPKLMSVSKSALFLTMISAAFGVVQMILKFYGFETLGVTETTMILVLGPFMVYFLSPIWFKEKIFKRDIFAFIVLILCILYVTVGKDIPGIN